MLYDVILATSSQRTDLEKFYQLHKTYVTASCTDVDINLRNALGPERFCKIYYRMVEKEKSREELLLNACYSAVNQLTERLKAWCRRMIGECGYVAKLKAWCCHTTEGEEEGEGCGAKLKVWCSHTTEGEEEEEGCGAKLKAWCSHTTEGEEGWEGCTAKLKVLFNGMVERKWLIASK